MLSTSGTYTYNTPETRVLIDNAYRRCGIQPNLIDDEKILAAQEAANLALQSWPNLSLNLWLRRTTMITLIPYQAKYDLPLYTSSVREVTRRTSVRDLSVDGIPTSSSGVAANAFDADPATACSQNAADGWIQYAWPVITSDVPLPLVPQSSGAQIITLVGITSEFTRDYTLEFSISQDGFNFETALSVPIQTYTEGLIQWVEVPSPKFGLIFRVSEVGGAVLNINELYFNNQVNDIPLTGISEAQYMRYPNKGFPNASAPSSFYVDQQINPVINLYPAPSPVYNNLFISYQTQIQDFGSMASNYAQIPARFINALTSQMAYYISLTYAPDRSEMLKVEAKEQLQLAKIQDRERVPIKIYGSSQQGGWY